MSPCPSPEELRRLVNEESLADERTALEAHVESCALCQRALARLTEDSMVYLAATTGVGQSRSAPSGQRELNEPDPPGPVASPTTRTDTIDPPRLDFLAPGSCPESLGRLDHYEILEVLGRGGFGIVLRAFDQKLHRAVAIKVLAPEIAATSPARKRFLHEARAAAGVRHESVVQIYAVEQSPVPYLVMEFVAGETLQQRIDRIGPLDDSEVATIGRQLAAGLAAAHAAGLIHRDIKPANILVERGEPLRVKITDFGVARAVDEASLTQSGVVIGTPLYMSPEQAFGAALDPRSDLFSLGSVLYAITSGRPPFRANNAIAILRRVAEDTPRPITEIIPETPEWLCRVIDRLMRKDPDDRFQTAGDVVETLALGPGASASSARNRRGRTSRRRLTVVVSLAAAAFFATSAWWTFGPGRLLGGRYGGHAAETSPSGTDLPPASGDPGSAGIGSPAPRPFMASPARNQAVPKRQSRSARTFRVADPDREAAAWAMARSGGVTLVGESRDLRTMTELPPGRIRLGKLRVGPFAVKDEELAHLDGLESLEELLIRSPLTTDAGLTHILGLTNLRTLNLGATRVTGKGFSALKALPRLAEIELEGTPTGDEGLAEIGEIEGLGILKLNNTNITGSGLARLSKLKQLTRLYVGGTDITDADLANLRGLHNLNELYLYYTPIGGGGFVHLKELPRLTHIWAAVTRVTDEGLATISELPSLLRLGISGTLVTDAGMAHLARCKSLDWLEIHDTAVTDAGLSHLEELAGLKNLTLHGTRVTPKGIERFRAAVPGCQIRLGDRVLLPRK